MLTGVLYLKRNDDGITQDYIKKATYYNEVDGRLYWREDRPMSHFSCKRLHTCYINRFANKPCGYWMPRSDSKKQDFGYYVMRINCKHIKVHRMIFLYHKGYLPKIVDHKDGNTRNNSISNLRDAGKGGNDYNQDTPSHNSTGYKGVAKSSSKNYLYKSGIMLHGKTYNIGYYNNIEEAAQAYNIVAKLLHKDFARFNDTNFPEEEVTKISKFWKVHYPLLLEEHNIE